MNVSYTSTPPGFSISANTLNSERSRKLTHTIASNDSRRERKRARIRHDAENTLVSSHRGRHGAMDEVHDDDGLFPPRAMGSA